MYCGGILFKIFKIFLSDPLEPVSSRSMADRFGQSQGTLWLNAMLRRVLQRQEEMGRKETFLSVFMRLF